MDETLVSLKSSKDKLTPEDMAALKRGGISSDFLHKMQRESKKERKTAQSICNHCKKLEVELANGPFKSCSKCVAAGCYTKYCSR